MSKNLSMRCHRSSLNNETIDSSRSSAELRTPVKGGPYVVTRKTAVHQKMQMQNRQLVLHSRVEKTFCQNRVAASSCIHCRWAHQLIKHYGHESSLLGLCLRFWAHCLQRVFMRKQGIDAGALWGLCRDGKSVFVLVSYWLCLRWRSHVVQEDEPNGDETFCWNVGYQVAQEKLILASGVFLHVKFLEKPSPHNNFSGERWDFDYLYIVSPGTAHISSADFNRQLIWSSIIRLKIITVPPVLLTACE